MSLCQAFYQKAIKETYGLWDEGTFKKITNNWKNHGAIDCCGQYKKFENLWIRPIVPDI